MIKVTVGDLIDYLRQFDVDEEVILSEDQDTPNAVSLAAAIEDIRINKEDAAR